MRYRIVAIILLVCLLLVSCGKPTNALPTIPVEATQTEQTSDTVTLTYAAFDYDRNTLEPILARFQDEHPNINVTITSLDDALQTTPDKSGNYPADSMMTMLRRVVSIADVAPSSWVVPEAYGTPLLRDIKPYMDADSAFQRDDYYPSILERFSVNGAQYILPRTISAQAIAYNKNLFDAAQIPAPEPTWTHADLFAIAEKLAKVTNGQIERYGWNDNNGGSIALLYLFEDAGVDILGVGPNELKAGDTRIINVLQKYADLVARGVIYGQTQSAYGAGNAMRMPGDYVDPAELIKAGKVAIWTDGAVYTPDGSAAQFTFDVGYATMPPGPHTDLNYYSEGFVMSGGTAHPSEAWTLMEWMTRQNLNPSAGSYAGYLAARKSLQALMLPSDDRDSARSDAYIYAISHLKPITHYTSQDYTAYYSLSSATMMMWENPPKSPADVLAFAVKSISDNQAYLQMTPSPTPDIRPVTVATPEAQQANANQTTITFAAYGTSMSEMRRYTRAFQKEDASIFVKIISTDNLTTTQSLVGAAARSDCFWWSQGIPLTDQDRAALADMQPLIDNEPSIAVNDIPQALLDVYRSDGRLLGFPHSYNSRALIYQEALFAKVGLDAPQASWSTDDFVRAAKALSGDGIYGYSSMGNYIGDLIFWSSRFGGNMVTGSGKDVRANYADPNVEKAIVWWLGLATNERVMPMPVFDYQRGNVTTTNDQSWELQTQGKIAMWMDTGNIYAKTSKNDPNVPAVSFTTTMAPPPLGERGLVSADINVVGYHISASAANPQACMKFIGFMSQQAYTNSYGNIPARKSLSTNPLFEEQNAYAVPLRDIMTPLLEQPLTVTTDVSSSYNIESYWLFQALDAIMQKKADPHQALLNAQTRSNDYMACIATIDGSKQSPTYASCAKKADPNYNGYMVDENTP